MFAFKIFICIFYGLVSIAQTLNSRFLFRTLQFNFYSVVSDGFDLGVYDPKISDNLHKLENE